MKRQIFSLVVTAISVLVAFTSCNGKERDDEMIDFLISGKFKSQTGNGDAVFYADYVSTAKKATDEKELVGKIKDGDIVFNLRGVYCVANKKFFLSAGSNNLVFQICGTLSDNNLSGAVVTSKVKTGDNWTVHTVGATNVASDDAVIKTNASNTQVEGIPQSWFGSWKLEIGNETRYYMMTPYQMLWLEAPEEPAGFIDFVSLGNGKLEMIWEMYIYNELGENKWTTREFGKVWLEGTEERLSLTTFRCSYSEDYAIAKAYNTSTPIVYPEDKGEVILTRP